MTKTILITGIGGLTPRSIATIIRKNHPEYKIIGCDIDKKAMGFFMKTKDDIQLVDEYFVCPRCTSREYFPWVEKLVAEKQIDYAFVQPESEIVEWGQYYEEYGKYHRRRQVYVQMKHSALTSVGNSPPSYIM